MTDGGLLVVGDVVTDVVARHGTALIHGTDTSARIRTVPGGAGANVACWATRSGCRDVRLLARVGADSAAWHREALQRAGVRCLLAVDDDVPTATVVALVDSAAERTFLTDSGAALRLSPTTGHHRCSTASPISISPGTFSSPRRAGRRPCSLCGRPGDGRSR